MTTAAIFVGILTAALLPVRWLTRRRAGTLDWRHEALVIGSLALLVVGLAAAGSAGGITQQVVPPVVACFLGLAMIFSASRTPQVAATRRPNLRVSGHVALGLGLLYLLLTLTRLGQ
jgi:hypothetical protein